MQAAKVSMIPADRLLEIDPYFYYSALNVAEAIAGAREDIRRNQKAAKAKDTGAPQPDSDYD